MTTHILSQPLTLPCGLTLKNRLSKSAMSENMGEPDHSPGERYPRLYSRWAAGGLGLCISGNVMIDPQHLGEPDNVVLEEGVALDPFKRWAASAGDSGMSLMLQLNHPGKQIPNFLNRRPVAPSAIPLDPKMRALFNTPRALTEDEIWQIIERFAQAARLAQSAGFAGVQIHGAHGYLVSQFLSPKHNQRQDQWGGDSERRMRFVLELYRAMRAQVQAPFAIGIKINSADFQKGSFTHEEAVHVCAELSRAGMDFIEISGGSYEKPIMMLGERDSTKKREAYFLQYAADIKKVVLCPLMVTGGFRSQGAMQSALASGDCDLIGLARPLAIEPDLPARLLRDHDVQSQVHPITTGLKQLDRLFPLEITWYSQQLQRMGEGRSPQIDASAWGAIMYTVMNLGWQGLRRVRAR